MHVASKTTEDRQPASQAVDGLLQQARLGDTQAFGGVVREYQDRVYNVCLRILGDRHLAEDTTQETFVRAFQALDRFDGRARFYTWLYRIAVNLCLSQRRVKRPLVPQVDGDGQPSPAHDLAARASSPLEGADREEKHAAVLAALAELDDEHRSVVVLRDIESLDYSEIAGILGIPTGTVKSRLHRARMSLRQRLARFMEP